MALMLTLDDAMNVLLLEGFLDEGYIDEDGGAEYVRNQLEQKCYLVMKKKNDSWFRIIRENVEAITCLEEIGKHIADNDLGKWLEMCRDNIIAELTLAARNKEEQ